jgi:hypothetical protein
MPPALDTADTSSAVATHMSPPCTMGRSTPKNSVMRVVSMGSSSIDCLISALMDLQKADLETTL